MVPQNNKYSPRLRKGELKTKNKKYYNPRDSLEYKPLQKICDKLGLRCYNDYLGNIESRISKH